MKYNHFFYQAKQVSLPLLRFLFSLSLLFIINNDRINAQSIAEKNIKYRLSSLQSQPSSSDNNLLRSFAGSLNALVNENSTGASFDLNLQTYHYFFPLRERKLDTITVVKSDGKVLYGRTKEKYRGIDIYVFNRAAINFDSLKSIANDYITSLQASPLTLRINKQIYLTENKKITENDYNPVVSLIITGDARAIPYGDVSERIKLGASGHLFLTLSTLIKRIEFGDNGEEIDKGTMYIEPSIGVVFGTENMMSTLYADNKNRALLTSELRIGFKSDNLRIKDWGLLLRYTWEDIVGPKFRAGITFTPNNN